MTDSITSDRALRAAKFALDGLALKQELIGHNLANVDTPQYRAQTVDFQTALRRSLNNQGRIQMQTTHAAHRAISSPVSQPQILERGGGSSRADGNNVDVDVELSQMAEAGIQYQAITQLVSKKFILLKNIVSGR